jgi:hypothetical protein
MNKIYYLSAYPWLTEHKELTIIAITIVCVPMAFIALKGLWDQLKNNP